MRMNAKGIYVILDMHEDVLSSKFCLYDGAPLWVVNKSTPKHEFPWPLKGNCSSRGWMENILSEAAGTAYQDLYDNKNGMRDDLALFWEKSAEFWKDLPGVFFELINEPFAGNPYEDPLILLPGVAGRKNLMRLYDAISPSIRKVDDRHIIMYEPVTWGMIFDGKYTGTGFDHVPGGDEYANRSALSFHYYCNTFVPSYGEKPTMTKIVCDDIVKNLVFSSITKELSKIGGSALMTEGISFMHSTATAQGNALMIPHLSQSHEGMACDTSTPQKEQECREVMSALDQHLYSWTDYGVSQGAQWTPSQAQQKAWARTFARATAGNPVNMTFDAGTGAFEYCYNVDTSIKAPTEIFASRKYYYTDGTNVRTTSNLEVVGPISDTISIKPVAGSDGGVGCVWVTQK